MEQPVHQGHSGLTGPRMHHRIGRLVDHQQMVVGVEHVERHRWIRGELDGVGTVGHVQAE